MRMEALHEFCCGSAAGRFLLPQRLHQVGRREGAAQTGLISTAAREPQTHATCTMMSGREPSSTHRYSMLTERTVLSQIATALASPCFLQLRRPDPDWLLRQSWRACARGWAGRRRCCSTASFCALRHWPTAQLQWQRLTRLQRHGCRCCDCGCRRARRTAWSAAAAVAQAAGPALPVSRDRAPVRPCRLCHRDTARVAEQRRRQWQ